jgi:hypothetical protein
MIIGFPSTTAPAYQVGLISGFFISGKISIKAFVVIKLAQKQSDVAFVYVFRMVFFGLTKEYI